MSKVIGLGFCNYGIFRLAVSLCNINPKYGDNAVDSPSKVNMSKNHNIRNRYSSHVPNRASTDPPIVRDPQETTSLGFTKKSGNARPYTVGTKQSCRAYCGVCVCVCVCVCRGGNYKGTKGGDRK
jgi:hypothetical protein